MSNQIKNKGSILIIVTIMSSLLSLVLFASLAIASSFSKSSAKRIFHEKEKLNAESNCIYYVNLLIKGEDISAFSQNIKEESNYYFVQANSDNNIYRCEIAVDKINFYFLNKVIVRINIWFTS